MAITLKRGIISTTISKIFGQKKANTDNTKSPLYFRIESSVNEINLIKEGKVKGIPAEDVLREL